MKTLKFIYRWFKYLYSWQYLYTAACVSIMVCLILVYYKVYMAAAVAAAIAVTAASVGLLLQFLHDVVSQSDSERAERYYIRARMFRDPKKPTGKPT